MLALGPGEVGRLGLSHLDPRKIRSPQNKFFKTTVTVKFWTYLEKLVPPMCTYNMRICNWTEAVTQPIVGPYR